jgi:uncharacterized protein YbjT (DUF2867 family)
LQRVLVTGATGTIGRQVVTELLAADCQIRAMTRNPDGAALRPPVEVVRGDFTDVDGFERCLEDVDAVFLVWTAPVDTASAAVSRIARHAQRIVYLTAPHKTPHPFFQQPNPVQRQHAELERLIEESGTSWTFLRPGMFAANALSWWGPQIRAGNVVRWPHAAAPTAPIHERDVAAVASRALLEPGHEGREYVLTGPESLSHLDQVVTIAEVVGRPLRYEELSPEEAQRELGFPAPALKMLLNAWEAALGQPAFVTTTVEAITGRRARTFRDWATDHAGDFATG